ncbi:2-polyprenyl-6-methoxyphenol hydroxylase [Xylogone sp. PMI_703]|nr:2-polyprenyl-6-methoxyphenol hydroxylase [Xylogone sp. PMI_703]
MAEQTDVLIVGSGSAGLCAATWLARCGIPCKILERRSGPMEIGQADGVQCRTVEIFESFGSGLVEKLLGESYHVREVTFWNPTGENSIKRSSVTADTAPGLSHQPHVILNQARVNGLLIEAMKAFNGQEIDYGYDIQNVQVDSNTASDPEAYPVTVTTLLNGEKKLFRAKYVLGCDGAHSIVRKSLGYKMIGDSSDSVWGVMDVYPQTNFPDIRKKAAIKSNNGTLMIIPREGGTLARFYIELPAGTVAKSVTLEDLHATAQRIFSPYTMDFAGTLWWSAYSIGQRVADNFSKDNRVFLTGDACHTHSPKAGQGMNVSLQDGYNIGWKLAGILKNCYGPEILKTYDLERSLVATNLVNFDRSFIKLFQAKVGQNGVTEEYFSEQFKKSGRYTAGITSTYQESQITATQSSKQHLAKNLTVGMRFPSAQVVRFCDVRAMHLVKALPSDGRWRLVIFAGDINVPASAKRLEELANYLDSENGPVRKYTSPGSDIDSFIEPIVVLSGKRLAVEQEQIPKFFTPINGPWKATDLHKVYVDDEHYNEGHGHAYELYGIDPNEGAVAIVRPDSYVSMITALEDHSAIGDFFSGFVLSPKTVNGVNGVHGSPKTHL